MVANFVDFSVVLFQPEYWHKFPCCFWTTLLDDLVSCLNTNSFLIVAMVKSYKYIPLLLSDQWLNDDVVPISHFRIWTNSELIKSCRSLIFIVHTRVIWWHRTEITFSISNQWLVSDVVQVPQTNNKLASYWGLPAISELPRSGRHWYDVGLTSYVYPNLCRCLPTSAHCSNVCCWVVYENCFNVN